MRYNDIKLQPLPGDKYLVLEEISFKDVVVPKNFVTNGADVPRILWSFYPPNKSDFLRGLTEALVKSIQAIGQEVVE